MQAQIGIRFREIETHESQNPEYVANRGDACFHCKTELYSTLQSIRNSFRSNSNDDEQQVTLFNGTNKDDLGDDTRVGLVAADNFDVRSPLIGISKDEVRMAAKYFGAYS